MPPRDGLREQFRGYPAIGAVHPVAANKQLRDTLSAIADIADGVFDTPANFDGRSAEEKAKDGDYYDSSRYYRLFDSQTLGLSVFEMDISAKIAEKAKSIWEQNDLGAVRQDVEGEADRMLPGVRLQLEVSGVMPVGGRLPMSYREPVRSKLAFTFNPGKHMDTYDLLFREEELIARHIGSRIKRPDILRQFVQVDFVPHVTFMVY